MPEMARSVTEIKQGLAELQGPPCRAGQRQRELLIKANKALPCCQSKQEIQFSLGVFLRLLSGKYLPVGYLGCSLVCAVTLETNPAPQAGERSELLGKALFNLIKWHDPEF